MLTLICGLPRAGKTTYSKRYDGICRVVHRDQSGSSTIKYVEEAGDGDIVVDGVYHTAKERQRLLKKYTGDKGRCVWLDTPTEIKKDRPGYSRGSELPFDPPTLSEGWDEIIIIRGDDIEHITAGEH